MLLNDLFLKHLIIVLFILHCSSKIFAMQDPFGQAMVYVDEDEIEVLKTLRGSPFEDVAYTDGVAAETMQAFLDCWALRDSSPKVFNVSEKGYRHLDEHLQDLCESNLEDLEDALRSGDIKEIQRAFEIYHTVASIHLVNKENHIDVRLLSFKDSSYNTISNPFILNLTNYINLRNVLLNAIDKKEKQEVHEVCNFLKSLPIEWDFSFFLDGFNNARISLISEAILRAIQLNAWECAVELFAFLIDTDKGKKTYLNQNDLNDAWVAVKQQNNAPIKKLLEELALQRNNSPLF